MPIVAAIVSIASWFGGKISEAAALAAILSVMYWLRDYLRAFVVWIYQMFQPFFDALFNFFMDIAAWVFESVLDLIIVIVNSFSFDFTVFNPANYITSLGPDVLNVLGILHVPQAVGLILSAIVIRLVLQLIPFVRLGS